MKKELLTLFCVAGISFPALGGTYNIAPKARATASSSLNADGDASKVNDGYIRLDNAGEWVSAAQMPYWQQLPYPWIRLDWDEEVTLSRIVLYDRPTGDAHTAGGDLFFSDGTRIGVVGIPDNGEPKVVEFAPKRVRWVKFEVNDAVGSHVGLSEIEAFPPAGAGGDFVSQVNPFIETTKGRYFFFITGNQPFGMIGAAPLTRNRNQYGGGYNYNSTEVLGFPQIHNWVLAGLTLMPTTGNVDPTLGEGHWKSHFRHEGEIAQPGYHRLFLEDYGIWVEQTATDRTGFYRLTFTRDAEAGILLNLGGYLASTTMCNARVRRCGELPIFLGFWLMLRAFGAIGLGSDMGAMQIAGSGWTIFSGILLLLCSLWILFQPLVFGTTAVIVWVGISLLFAGVAACSLSLQLHRAHRCLGDR